MRFKILLLIYIYVRSIGSIGQKQGENLQNRMACWWLKSYFKLIYKRNCGGFLTRLPITTTSFELHLINNLISVITWHSMKFIYIHNDFIIFYRNYKRFNVIIFFERKFHQRIYDISFSKDFTIQNTEIQSKQYTQQSWMDCLQEAVGGAYKMCGRDCKRFD